ncbi:hypothetical protein ABZ801_19535 [Actinomadura sp. NPDC047616]|uniref:hypothetical protein n=1 Tax=Actinomadura sp. NPDC047616 TaxID=3155914 RepID=UPI0033D9AE16
MSSRPAVFDRLVRIVMAPRVRYVRRQARMWQEVLAAYGLEDPGASAAARRVRERYPVTSRLLDRR